MTQPDVPHSSTPAGGMVALISRAATLLWLGIAYPGTAWAQQGSRLWRPEERVVLTDFTRVEAVAADDAVVYSVTRNGVAVYDHRFRRWEPGLATADQPGVEGWTRVFDAVADPSDRSLWIGTDRGLAHYQRSIARLESVLVPGGVMALWLDPSDPFAGVYFRDRTGWQILRPGGMVPVPARLPEARAGGPTRKLAELAERYPSLTTLSARVLTDRRMRSHRFTSAAEAPGVPEVFLGTDGLGLVRFDPAISEFEILPFGLITQGAGALALADEGVWAGGTDISGEPAVSFVGNDLQRFEYLEGPRVTGFGGSVVHDLLLWGDELWVATDAGIALMDETGNPRPVAAARGLASRRVNSLASGPDGVWVGTDRGLALLAGASVERVGEPYAVWDLASAGDSVWVATPLGLGLAVAGSGRVVVAPHGAGVPELGEEIVAVAVTGDAVVAATRDRLIWRERGAGSGQQPAESAPPAVQGSWIAERPMSAELGRVTCLAAQPGGVWIGGERGFALYRFAGRQFTFFDAPGDVPGIVRDIAAAERYLWVAADGGLVRFELAAVVPEER